MGDEERLLLGGRMAPITKDLGFVEASVAEVCDAYTAWMRPIMARYGMELRVERAAGDLESVLARLLPLTNMERRRYLFVPTRSRWTAFLDNGHAGTDVFAPVSYLCQAHGWRGLRLLASPGSGLSFELFGPPPQGGVNGYVRTVSLIDDDPWTFETSGEPLAFERTERYAARRLRDRFSLDLLAEYAEHLGLHPFDAGWYLPAGEEARLVAKHGGASPRMREFTLAQARDWP